MTDQTPRTRPSDAASLREAAWDPGRHILAREIASGMRASWYPKDDIDAQAEFLSGYLGAYVVAHAAAIRGEGLDVERMAGMSGFWPLHDDDHRWCDEDSGGHHRFDSRAWAQDFAAEYARLARSSDSEGEGDA